MPDDSAPTGDGVPAAGEQAPGDPGTVSIGEAAEACGTTPRTLRYYEELGLVASSRSSASGQRRYGTAEIDRIRRIRELQSILGLELEEIAEHLSTTDRLDGLRAEYVAGPPDERREAILRESAEILVRLRGRVVERTERLAAFLDELDERIARVEKAQAELSGPSDAARGR